MSIEERRKEFFDNVWDHSKDPFQAQFDVVPPFSDSTIDALRALHLAIRNESDDTKVSGYLKNFISANGTDLMACLLQIAGLTRNKIVTDLHATQYQGHKPSTYKGLHTSDSWSITGPYLARKLRSVLEPIETLEDGVIAALNAATRPGFMRQERAKRQGHEAEARLAAVLAALEIAFEPTAKIDNPLCPDAQLNDVSFDLVVPDTKSPLVVVKSTVHTSNIGQYGESKDHLEITQARTMLKQKYEESERPTLLALIDGVGFRSNAAGLNGVLQESDEFCQFGTLWKAVVIVAYRMGRKCHIDGEAEYLAKFASFLNKYQSAFDVTALPDGFLCGKVRLTVEA